MCGVLAGSRDMLGEPKHNHRGTGTYGRGEVVLRSRGDGCAAGLDGFLSPVAPEMQPPLLEDCCRVAQPSRIAMVSVRS